MSGNPPVSCDCEPNAFGESSTVPSDVSSATVGQTSFIAPSLDEVNPYIIIEFCNRCRWLHRATWTLTELLLTFPSPALKSISLIPLESTETAGRFRVWVMVQESQFLVWDRKTEGGFPELKVLKQRIRDHIAPGLGLGHSDAKKSS